MTEARKSALRELVVMCKKRMGVKGEEPETVMKDRAALGKEDASAETGDDETKESEGGLEGLMDFLKAGPLKGPSVKSAGVAAIVKPARDKGKEFSPKDTKKKG